MLSYLQIAQYFSSLAFLFFGISCLLSKRMVLEFQRYGLSRFRMLVGVLQLLGSAGLVIDERIPWVALVSACGLALLMFLGVMVRVIIRDSFYALLPALLLSILNFYILVGLISHPS